MPEPKNNSPTDVAAAREQERQGRIDEALRRLKCDQGDKYAAATINGWQATSERQRTIKAAVIDYCRTIRDRWQEREGVLLYGPVGTGKDHLASGIARAAIMAELSVRWLRGQEWFGSLRDAIDNDKSEAKIFKSLACDVLVVSDPLPPIGALTQYQASMLYRLIEDRYSRGGVIVATVNVASDDEADSRMGAQTWDRLKDRAWAIHCEWKSYRKPARVI